MNNPLTPLPHVVIVGAGFGGLRAARALANAPVRITLLDRNNYHLFQPLLYQVATASLSLDEITQPVRAILGRQRNLEFRMAEVTGVDLDGRRLTTPHGDIPYDYLILAVGGATAYFGLESVERNGLGLKTAADAAAIRNTLLRALESAAAEPDPVRRRDLLTFVVAGGGPSGVETAGAVAELLRHTLPTDYPSLDPAEARVVLLEAGERLLPAMHPRQADFTRRVLEHKGVTVRLGAAVEAYDGQTVTLRGGETLPARTLIWSAGIRAAGLVEAMDLPRGSLGRVRVTPSLQLPAHPQVFVIGDAAYLEQDGSPLPMVAQVAIQQGRHAARAILDLLRGRDPDFFRYTDLGTMATIGRNQAVANLFGLRVNGPLAWLAWVAVHIFQLVGFRNRLMVMTDWAWNYLAYDRPVRSIHPDAPPARGARKAGLSQ